MQQDYLLRMIQQLGGFVAGVMKLRMAGEPEQAIREIDDAYGRFAGLSPSLIHAISEDDLIQLLRARGGLDIDRGWALAELLREEGLDYDALGQPDEAMPRLLKSLRLYLEVIESTDDLPSLVNISGLEEVIERVADRDLSPATREQLVAFLESTSRFADAENVVLWSLDWTDHDGARHQFALEFYERLLQVPDDRLQTGGLSLAEVHDGIGRLLLTAPASEAGQ